MSFLPRRYSSMSERIWQSHLDFKNSYRLNAVWTTIFNLLQKITQRPFFCSRNSFWATLGQLSTIMFNSRTFPGIVSANWCLRHLLILRTSIELRRTMIRRWTKSDRQYDYDSLICYTICWSRRFILILSVIVKH